MEPRIIENHHFQDDRGRFVKAFDGAKMDEFRVAQSNCVTTTDKGTFRGLHMQCAPFSEAKLFSVVKGSIQLVCVNIEGKDIPMHKTYSFILDDASKAVFVPKGFATGYLTTDQDTTVLYFSDELYKPEAEKGIRWNDPNLKVEWMIKPQFISEKDRKWPTLQ